MGLTRVVLVARDVVDAKRWMKKAPADIEVVARATMRSYNTVRGHQADRIEITEAARTDPRLERVMEVARPCIVVGRNAPRDLTDAEIEVWNLVADDIDNSPVAVELLRAWCATVVELRASEAWVREHGPVLTLRDDKGNVRSRGQDPRYVQVRALRADLVRLADALGLSPGSRAVATGGGGKDDGEAAEVVDPLAEARANREARLRAAGTAK